MTEQIRQIATYDTPSGVEIPPGGKSLIIWAIGRWGGGIIIALFFFYAWDREDSRSAEREDALLDAYRQQSTLASETSAALRANTQSIRELTRAAERSHR